MRLCVCDEEKNLRHAGKSLFDAIKYCLWVLGKTRHIARQVNRSEWASHIYISLERIQKFFYNSRLFPSSRGDKVRTYVAMEAVKYHTLKLSAWCKQIYENS